jgi:hypothetical protein
MYNICMIKVHITDSMGKLGVRSRGWREVDDPRGLHLIVEQGSINSLSRLSLAC